MLFTLPDSSAASACAASSGYVSNSSDCNDGSSSVRPGATETCNGLDDNCSGAVDEGVLTTYYRDADADTFGSPSVTASACALPSGYVTSNTDCNDAAGGIRPNALEIWYDGVDQNCDGRSDYDRDFDGFLSSSYGGTDCNDNNKLIKPGGREIAGDGVDGNCNGLDNT